MYILIYRQPHEYDDDSPSGVGDHEIRWNENQRSFQAENTEEARRFVVRFLLDGGIKLSPQDDFTYRRFLSLKYEEDIGLGDEYSSLLAVKGAFL